MKSQQPGAEQREASWTELHVCLYGYHHPVWLPSGDTYPNIPQSQDLSSVSHMDTSHENLLAFFIAHDTKTLGVDESEGSWNVLDCSRNDWGAGQS